MLKFFLLIVTLSQFGKSEPLPSDELRIPIYSYYSSSFKDHYLTPDYSELTTGSEIYAYDGIAFYLRKHQDEEKNSVPLFLYYRGYPLYDHYYVTDPTDEEIASLHGKKAKILGYCYPEAFKMEGMVPLTRYYHDDKKDHAYQIEEDEEILNNLEIGDLRADEYEYQGIECYVFKEERDDVAVIKAHNMELNEPRDMRKVPGELIDVLTNNDESQINGDELFTQNGATTNNKGHHFGVYGFITVVMIIGIITSVLYFYGFSKGKVLNEAEAQPLLV